MLCLLHCYAVDHWNQNDISSPASPSFCTTTNIPPQPPPSHRPDVGGELINSVTGTTTEHHPPKYFSFDWMNKKSDTRPTSHKKKKPLWKPRRWKLRMIKKSETDSKLNFFKRDDLETIYTHIMENQHVKNLGNLISIENFHRSNCAFAPRTAGHGGVWQLFLVVLAWIRQKNRKDNLWISN